jgi:hypothetical protein
MPKKPPHQRASEGQLIAWYKWEFLRRNPKYRKDYDAFIRKFGAWFHKHGLLEQAAYWSPRVWNYYGRAIAPRARRLCQKWQVIDLFPPDWKFSQDGSYAYSSADHVLLPTGYTSHEIRELWNATEHRSQLTLKSVLKSIPTNTRGNIDRIRYYNLRLDFAQPLPTLFAQAREEITQRKRRYDRAHPEPPTPRPAKRLRLAEYEQYLRIWDLWVKDRTFVEIGKVVFPNQIGSAQRARDNHRAAERLIAGGYKEIGS